MKNMMRRCLAVILPFVFFWSCFKSPLEDLSNEDGRVYITNRDDSAVFTSYKTFSIVDSILIYNNNGPSSQLTADDVALLNSIKSLMQSRGYVLVNKGDSPHLGINVTKIDQRYTSIIFDPVPGGWSGLPGYWDPIYWGYGTGYYYPPSYYTVSTREEIIFIDLLDIKNAIHNNGTLHVIWNAQLRGPGVMQAEASVLGVEMAFEQSPYLKAQ
jgi:Domain of unknown function (DUF4136)